MINPNFDPDIAREKVLRAFKLYDKYVPGMARVGRLMIMGAIQGGVCHVLGQGAPGGGKTRSAEVVAELIGGKSHIQIGHPDKRPNDIMGGEWMDQDPDTGKKIWRIAWSPLHDAHVNVSDEHNRLSTTCQSVFFGPMSEGKCTVAAPHCPPEDCIKWMHAVRIFLCIQNDVGSEGTNDLPPAQYDRFLYLINFLRIAREFERELMMNPWLGSRKALEALARERAQLESEGLMLTLDDILDIREWIQANMRVHPNFVDYQLTVIRASDRGTDEWRELGRKNPAIRPILEHMDRGASVRGNLALLDACKVRAFLFGTGRDGKPRKFLMPEDLRDLAHDVLDHRVILSNKAATRRVPGNAVDDIWSKEYATNGPITKQEVVHRLNRPGRNPILQSHVIDAILTHIDHSDDFETYDSEQHAA